MATFRTGGPSRFTDLKTTLAQSQKSDNAMYQTVERLIDRLDDLVGGGTRTIITGGGGGGGGTGLPGMNLDYLGNYVGGPTYNDGDIVVGVDNILYMCVVDGTTTPPDPWPGTGIISPGLSVVDATYWTVSPHTNLTNERALNTLANGYVKSTAGEPSTVAIIPVSDGGTGANNPGGARVNLGVGTVGTLNYPGDTSTFLRGDGQFAIPPGGAGGGVPSGVIILTRQVACPPGYTRITFDGFFPRINSAPGGTGGSGSHTHTLSGLSMADHTHGPGSFQTVWHSHGGRVDIDVRTDMAPLHAHSVNLANGSGQTHIIGDTGSASNPWGVSALSSGVQVSRDIHTHHIDMFSDVYNVMINGSTDGAGNHDHRVQGSAGISAEAPAITGISGGASNLGVTGTVDGALHIPPFVDFLFCEKN